MLIEKNWRRMCFSGLFNLERFGLTASSPRLYTITYRAALSFLRKAEPDTVDSNRDEEVVRRRK